MHTDNTATRFGKHSVERPGPQDCRDALEVVLRYIGEDPAREGLVDTPKRIVKSWDKLLGGYRMDPREILERIFHEKCDEMVVLKGIEFYSFCEHHMLPFFGKASIAYIPDGRVVGVSKLARLLECYARRLQVQERLTDQIAQAIMEYLKPKGAAVVLTAKHLCMTSRGVEKQNSEMITSSLQGVFRSDERVRKEFLQLGTS